MSSGTGVVYSLKVGMVYQLFGDIPCFLFVFFINLPSIEKHDMMRNTLLFYCLLFCWIFSGRALLAQSVHGYCPLDKAHPVYFYGDRISYAGTEIKLDKKTFLSTVNSLMKRFPDIRLFSIALMKPLKLLLPERRQSLCGCILLLMYIG